ncbi:MAG: hypothetical protein WD267_00860 [Balneolales bacterium]
MLSIKYLTRGLALLMISIFISTNASAQQRIQHQPPTLIKLGEDVTLTFSAPGFSIGQANELYIMYREEGDIAYTRDRATFGQNNIIAKISTSNMSANSIEYYLLIEHYDGSQQTYPQNNPEEQPVSIGLVNSDQSSTDHDELDIQYNIMSPEPGKIISTDDALVALALFYPDDSSIPDSLKVYFDGNDVTAQASVNQFFITYIPENLIPGKYEIQIAYVDQGNETRFASWDFEIFDPRVAMMQQENNRTLPRGRIELNARNQAYGGIESEIYRGSLRLSGSEGSIRYSINGLLTSQESSRLQPQNRLAGELFIGNWFKLQVGHVYPQINPLLIGGRRMMGLNSSIELGNFIKLDVLYGELNRNISHQYKPVSQKIDTLSYDQNGEAITETSFVMGIEPGGQGTFSRNIAGGRVGFGGGRTFQLGLNALKVEDDVNSLNIINGFEDISATDLNSKLTTSQINSLNQNPDLFRLEGNNPTPDGNFILGSDLLVNMHRNRIQLRTDVAASLYNTNITEGPINQNTADDLGIDLDSNLENMLDRLSRLIVINEHMNTLPIKISNEKVEPFVPMGIFAGQSRLGLNYFRNNITIQYRWVGPDYTSLANNSIRRDIAGYSITDRFRMFQNTLFATIGHDRHEDNVIDNKDATTVSTSYKGNLSWYPINQNYPRLSVGINHQTRDNSIERVIHPDLGHELSFSAVRNVYFINGNANLLPTPRSTSTLQYTASVSKELIVGATLHEASINFSDMTTEDKMFSYGDYESRYYSLSISSDFQYLPLKTSIAISTNNAKSASSLNTSQINGINIGGSYFILDNKLNLYADLAITRNTFERVQLSINDNGSSSNFFDDYYQPDYTDTELEKSTSYSIRTGTQYNINKYHSVIVSMNLTNVVDRISLQNIPSDRTLQARYVFNF